MTDTIIINGFTYSPDLATVIAVDKKHHVVERDAKGGTLYWRKGFFWMYEPESGTPARDGD